MKDFDYFYYINERFPTNNDPNTTPDRDVPDFIHIKSPEQKISPCQLYEMIRGTKSHALVSTQYVWS